MEQHPRGVFYQEYDGPSGSEVLVAVDRRGRCVARAFVRPSVDRDPVVRSFRSLLSSLDPPPIRLMS